jgi:hypothetical protein
MEMVRTQVGALTYQNSVTLANMAANTSQNNNHQFSQLAMQQNMMHENLHQIITQVNALTFNASNKEQETGHVSSWSGYGSNSHERNYSGPHSGGYTPAPPPGRFHGGPGGYQVASKVAHWPAALSLTAPHRQRRDKVSPCYPALQITLPKRTSISYPTQQLSRNFSIGTLATLVVLMWPMAIPACCALHIYARRHTTFTSTARMPSNTSSWDILAAQNTATRPSFPTCDGLGWQIVAT